MREEGLDTTGFLRLCQLCFDFRPGRVRHLHPPYPRAVPFLPVLCTHTLYLSSVPFLFTLPLYPFPFTLPPYSSPAPFAYSHPLYPSPSPFSYSHPLYPPPVPSPFTLPLCPFPVPFLCTLSLHPSPVHLPLSAPSWLSLYTLPLYPRSSSVPSLYVLAFVTFSCNLEHIFSPVNPVSTKGPLNYVLSGPNTYLEQK